jgi:hypothetical protein
VGDAGAIIGRTPATASHFYKSLFLGDISTRLRSSTSGATKFSSLSIHRA